MHYVERKVLLFDSNFTKVCSWGSSWQKVDIGLDNSLVSPLEFGHLKWHKILPDLSVLTLLGLNLFKENLKIYVHFLNISLEIASVAESIPSHFELGHVIHTVIQIIDSQRNFNENMYTVKSLI